MMKRSVVVVAGMMAAAAGMVAIHARLHAREPKEQPQQQQPAAAERTTVGSHAPLDQLQVELDAFHVRDGAPDEQMEVVHYCSEVAEGMFQCALFHGQEKDARLVGVEYVISAARLAKLPAEERALWHSHSFEVTSGQLVAVGKPAAEEHKLMETLAGTYGKTWHTWQVDRGDELPVGRPTLMMSLTRDGQLKASLMKQRDQRFGIDSAAIAQRRRDIKPVPIARGVDTGEQGRSCAAPTALPQRQPVRGTQ